MEYLQIEREQLRRHFKKNCEKLELALAETTTSKSDLLVHIKILENTSNKLFSLDENIRELLCSNNVSKEELEKEFEDIQFYQDKIITCKIKCEVLLTENRRQEDQASLLSENGENSKRKFKLPKLELKKFDGKVKNWIGFWGQFKKIHEDKDIDDEDKFQYLFQAMEPGTVARELIESFPPSGKNYYKAVDQLKARFARDELLIEIYVRELLGLVLKQATSNKEGMSLSSLYDKLETQLRALETLGVTTEKYAAMLFPLVESALPAEILIIWERYRSSIKIQGVENEDQGGTINSKNINLLKLLLEFLRKEVESQERIHLAQASFEIGRNQDRKDNKINGSTNRNRQQKECESEIYTAAALHTSSKDYRGKKVLSCIFCDKAHASQECIMAQKLSLEERKAKILSKKACFSCLKPNHTSRNCRAFIRCLICAKKHYPIVCSDLLVKKEQKVNEKEEKSSGNVENVLANTICTGILLQTLIVRLISNNKERLVRAILDSGSQRSYILSKCAKGLGFAKTGEENIIQGVFGGSESAQKRHAVYEIVIQNLNRNFEFKLSVLEQEKICNYLPRLEDSFCLELLKRKNIILSDVSINNTPHEVELLLGADVFGKLLTGNLEYIKESLVAIETHLGWTIIGQPGNNNMSTTFCGLTSYSLPDLWKLDILGITDPAEVKAQEEIEDETVRLFNETIDINKEDRYEINLPWVENHSSLLSNESLAKTRLQSTTKKLLGLKKFESYGKVFEEWEALGIIEEVKEEEKNTVNVHYLCHHAVVKESSTTTKIRPVFDASARDPTGNSLNDCLQKGPNLIELIPPLLLKFRLGLIGITADIEKAFLQISITPKDRDLLRFFGGKIWRNRKLKFTNIAG